MTPAVGDRITWTEFRHRPNERQYTGIVIEKLGDVSVCYRVVGQDRNCIVHGFKIDSVERVEK